MILHVNYIIYEQFKKDNDEVIRKKIFYQKLCQIYRLFYEGYDE